MLKIWYTNLSLFMLVSSDSYRGQNLLAKWDRVINMDLILYFFTIWNFYLKVTAQSSFWDLFLHDLRSLMVLRAVLRVQTTKVSMSSSNTFKERFTAMAHTGWLSAWQNQTSNSNINKMTITSLTPRINTQISLSLFCFVFKPVWWLHIWSKTYFTT